MKPGIDDERIQALGWLGPETDLLELLSAGAPLHELLEKTALAIDSALPGVISSIMLLDESGYFLQRGAAPHLPSDYYEALEGLPIGPRGGSCGTAAYRAVPVIVPDIKTNPLWDDYRDLALSYGLRACWSAPVLSSAGLVTAVSALYFREPRTPTEEDTQLMLRVARLVGIAIDQELSNKEFRHSQALLSMASRISRLGAWEVRLPDFHVTWSPEMRALYEVETSFRPSLEKVLDFYTPEHRRVMREAIDACISTGTPFDLEAEIVTACGRNLWVRALAEGVRNAEGIVILVQGAVQDISEQKRTARALKQQKWLLQVAGEVAQVGGWAVDLPDYRVVISDITYDILGLPRGSELPLEQGIGYYHAGSREQLRDAIARCIEEGTPFELELELTNAAGKPLWARVRGEAERAADGTILRARGAMQNITSLKQTQAARKLAETTLRESEERFRLVAKTTSDVVWDWNLVQGKIWWSEGMYSQFGHDPGHDAGTESWTDFIHPEDLQRVSTSIHKVIDGDETFWRDEYRFRRNDGTYAEVADQGHVIRNETGKAIRMLGSMTDITERRKLEDRIRQAHRLEAVGQLTGGVAHDFNNLLTVILGNAELLAEALSENPKLGHFVEVTRKAALQAAELTHRLLAFARRQTLDPKPTDINKLIDGMDGLLRRALGENIDIQTIPGAGLWMASIDAAQLENAVLNLCINARDAMQDGGQLTIETSNTHLDEEYASSHAGAVAGEYVMVGVTDKGHGMTPDVLARVFDPFFTTKAIGKGSGLGLSMVYGFVKQSKGYLNIYSEPGHGTSVQIYLPRAHGAGKQPQGIPKREELPRGTEKILLVEDNDLVRECVFDQLESLGYGVLLASDGPKAIEIFRENPGIDLLLTDLIMPGGMNGMAVAEQAWKLRPGLPVLFTSGYTENAALHQGSIGPGTHLLQKPYRKQDLATKIRMVLEEARKKAT